MTPVLEVPVQWVQGPGKTGAWEVELSHPGCEYCRGLVDTAITEARYVSRVPALTMHHRGTWDGVEVDHTISIESLSYRGRD